MPSLVKALPPLTVYVLNSTAPTQVVGDTPTAARADSSSVSTVNFFISAPAATVQGDPSFSGFHGQPSYQVHGIPGEVFNVLTASDASVARIIYIH